MIIISRVFLLSAQRNTPGKGAFFHENVTITNLDILPNRFVIV